MGKNRINESQDFLEEEKYNETGIIRIQKIPILNFIQIPFRNTTFIFQIFLNYLFSY